MKHLQQTEHPADQTHLDPVSFIPTPDIGPPVLPIVEYFNPIECQEQGEDDVDPNPTPFKLILANSEEYEQKIDEFGIPIYWNKITGDASPTPVQSIDKLNYHLFFSMFLMSVSTACPTSFKKAFALTDWHPPIFKEMDNFIDNNCFQWATQADNDVAFLNQIGYVTQSEAGIQGRPMSTRNRI